MAKQEVAKTETKAVGPAMDFGSFGVENIITSDLRIPKLLLMQAMSDFVTDGKARLGDIVDSFEARKVGDEKTPVQIIPFYVTNSWTIKKEQNGKMVFDKIEDRGGNDVRREYEIIGQDGVKRTQHRTLNVFALMKNGNLSVPYMISFLNASFTNAAQPFLNKVQLLKAEGKAPAHVVFNLGVTKEENDKGKWFAFTLEAAKNGDSDLATTQEELEAAYKHYTGLTTSLKSGAKIDMTDVAADEAPTQAPNNIKAKF